MKSSFNRLSRLSQIAFAVVTVTSAAAAPLYFDSASNTLWDNATTLDWSAASAGPYSSLWSDGSDAVFEGTAGTVDVSGTISSVASITFSTDGYQLGSSAGSGVITLTGAGGNVTTGAGNDTIASALAGTVGLTKLGAGTLTLSAGTAASGTYLNKNTFSGAVNVSAGTLVLAPTPFSPNTVLTPGLYGGVAAAGNNVTIASGATLKAGAGTNGVFNGIQRLTVNGTLDFNGANGNNGTNANNGLGALSGNGTVIASIVTKLILVGDGSDETFSGNFSGTVGLMNVSQQSGNALRGGSQTLNIGGGTGTATFTSILIGQAAASAYSTLTLAGGTVNVSSSLVLGSNSDGVLNVQGGTLNINSGGSFRIGEYGSDKFGQNKLNQSGGAINVLGSTGTFKLAMHYHAANTYWPPSDAMNLSGGTFTSARNLSVSEGDTGSNPGRPAFFTVSGTADVTIPSFVIGSNANGGYAQFDLNGGTLNAGSFTKTAGADANGYFATGIVNFNGGTLKATASGDLFTGFTPGSNTVTATQFVNLALPAGGSVNLTGRSDGLNVKTGGAIIDTNGKAVTITPGLSGTTGDGGLTVGDTAGTGTLTLAGANTYQGPTTIQTGGKLALTGSATIGNSSLISVQSGATFDVAALASAWTLGSGQTLKGSGVVAGPVQIAGIVSPGDGVGTLTVGSTSFSSGTLAIEIDGTNCDKLTASGALDLTGANLTVSEPGGGFTEPSYVIVDCASLTGTFASVPTGYTVTYSGTQAILSKVDYDTWVTNYPGFVNTASTADPDGDGLTNQQEYAFGLNPTLGSSVNPITVPLNKTTGTFTYTRRKTGLTGLNYMVQTSTDLATWMPATSGESVTDAGDNQTVVVTLSGAPLSAPKLFVRVVAQ